MTSVAPSLQEFRGEAHREVGFLFDDFGYAERFRFFVYRRPFLSESYRSWRMFDVAV
jgi:hypothetical protein